MNEAEQTVAKQLFEQAPGAGYVLGDGNYDSSPLFDAAAAAGYQLVVPLPDPNTGKGLPSSTASKPTSPRSRRSCSS